jgi:hypothetical protein
MRTYKICAVVAGAYPNISWIERAVKYAPCFRLLAPLVVVAAVVRAVQLVDPPAQIVKQLDQFLVVETRILKIKLTKEHSQAEIILTLAGKMTN